MMSVDEGKIKKINKYLVILEEIHFHLSTSEEISSMLQESSQNERDEFLKKLSSLSTLITDLRVLQLNIFATWLQGHENELKGAIRGLEDTIDGLVQLNSILQGISNLFQIFSSLVTGLPI